MKNCTSCGAELQSHWKFCTNCQAPQPAQSGGSAAAETTQPDHDAVRSEQPTQRFEQAPGQSAADGQPGQRAESTATSTSVFDPPVMAPAAKSADATGTSGSGFAAPGTPAGPGGTGNNGPGGMGNNGPSGPQGPGGTNTPPSAPKGPRKRSRKVIILVSVLVVLLAVGIGAFFYVQNLIRGGASSPQGAADQLMESIETKDMIGLATLVPLEEREPIQRIQEHLADKMEEFKLEEALTKVGRDEELSEDEFSFDGVTISMEGVEPEIKEIDESTALIRYASGEVKVDIDPAATTGTLRTIFDSLEEEEKVSETIELGELGPDGSPLTLVATERDGRWYISPMYSVAEMVNASESYDRGSVPEASTGSNSPAEAAKAMVEAVPSVISEGSLSPLAGTLSIHEGSLLYLYQDMFDDAMSGMNGEEISVSDVRFTEGEKDGNRATAVVDNIRLENDYGDEITLTSECIKGESDSDSFCLNGSGYTVEPSAQMFGGLQNLSVTTLEENGKWRVSLGHTLADAVIDWTDSLTREQALALLSLAHSEDASGDIAVDDSTDVTFNSAGFAVLNLRVDEEMSLAAEDEYDFGDMTVYSKDGKEEITTLGYGDEIPEGDYKLVVFAGPEWDEERAEDGGDIDYSKELTLVEDSGTSFSDSYLDPGKDYFYGLLSLSGEAMTHTLKGIEDDGELMFEVSGSVLPIGTPGTVVVTMDGEEHELKLVAGEPATVTIPYPGDGEEHEVTVELFPGEGATTAFLSYNGELSAN